MIKLNMRLKNADVIKERFLGAFILEANKFMQYSFFNIILSDLNCQYVLSFIWAPVCLWKLDLLCKMLKYNLYKTAQK